MSQSDYLERFPTHWPCVVEGSQGLFHPFRFFSLTPLIRHRRLNRLHLMYLMRVDNDYVPPIEIEGEDPNGICNELLQYLQSLQIAINPEAGAL